MKLLWELEQAVGLLLFSIILLVALLAFACFIIAKFNIPDSLTANLLIMFVFVIIPFFVIIWKISKYY